MWERLFVPPVLASIVAYLATKDINDLKEKLVAFWALWAAVGSAVHLLLGLPPLIALAYPLLALSTGAFMYRGLKVAHKGRSR